MEKCIASTGKILSCLDTVPIRSDGKRDWPKQLPLGDEVAIGLLVFSDEFLVFSCRCLHAASPAFKTIRRFCISRGVFFWEARDDAFFGQPLLVPHYKLDFNSRTQIYTKNEIFSNQKTHSWATDKQSRLENGLQNRCD